MANRRRAAYWACQGAGWTAAVGLSLVFAADGRLPVGQLAALGVTGAGTAIAVSHAYRAVVRKLAWSALTPLRLLPRVLLASVVLGGALTATMSVAWWLVLGRLGPVAYWLLPALTSWGSFALMWNLIYFGVHYFERWRTLAVDQLRLEIAARDAQLDGLVARLQPHFLFNCLNSVRALIAEDPERARAAVTALSDLLRYALRATRDTEVPLAAELAIVADYLELEHARFEDRLRWSLAISDDARPLRVPPLVVQALVENGVKHGIERTACGGVVEVAAWRDADELRIRVSNPGQLAHDAGTTRIGLANTRERLRLLYGDRASLALVEEDGRVVATVAIPVGAGA